MSRIDPAELGRWYDAHAAALVLYARQFLPPGEAEDAVQDVFVRAMALRRGPDHVKAWLFRAVRNEAISRLRSSRRRRRREQVRAAEKREAFESQPGDLVDARMAERLLAALPDQQREVVVLRVWAGLTLEEVTAVTGGSVATAHRRYRAALAAIRKAMEPSCKRETI